MPPAGLYFHIPFCRQKCSYCDFYSLTDGSSLAEFLPALQNEIILRAAPTQPVDTVYFGGGTPSLCPPSKLAEILTTVKMHFDLQAGAEITLEVNPGTVGGDDLKHLAEIGINRLNIGIQSFRDDALRYLGRIHDRVAALGVVEKTRRAGFDNLGLDLIYGLPEQTAADWISDLEQALVYHPEHLSCYILTFEPGTPMTRHLNKGRFPAPDEDAVGQLFETTAEFLTARGYDHYEISNFARSPRMRSRHNLKYWRFLPYLGFGPSAHSYCDGRRSWNLANMNSYCRLLAQARHPEGGQEVLTEDQQMLEAIMIGLRLKEGLSRAAFKQQFQRSLTGIFGPLLDDLEEGGYLMRSSSHCALTIRGMRYHDSIVARFAAEL